MAQETKAFCTWTCDRCTRKESTCVTIHPRAMGDYGPTIGVPALPEGWQRLAKRDLCDACAQKVLAVLNG